MAIPSFSPPWMPAGASSPSTLRDRTNTSSSRSKYSYTAAFHAPPWHHQQPSDSENNTDIGSSTLKPNLKKSRSRLNHQDILQTATPMRTPVVPVRSPLAPKPPPPPTGLCDEELHRLGHEEELARKRWARREAERKRRSEENAKEEQSLERDMREFERLRRANEQRRNGAGTDVETARDDDRRKAALRAAMEEEEVIRARRAQQFHSDMHHRRQEAELRRQKSTVHLQQEAELRRQKSIHLQQEAELRRQKSIHLQQQAEQLRRQEQADLIYRQQQAELLRQQELEYRRQRELRERERREKAARLRDEELRRMEEERVERERREAWRRREEEAKRAREEELRRLREEEMRRQQEQRMRDQPQWEREQRYHAHLNLERAKKERERIDKLILDAWNNYEAQWNSLLHPRSTASLPSLTFRTIPWPTLHPPHFPAQIAPHHIEQFILSPVHSTNKSHRIRLRDALLRWHPDKFESKWLARVQDPEDRRAVREGVAIVSRCLSGLMARDGAVPLRSRSA